MFIASAGCVISIIINAPAVSCTPKQTHLLAFLSLQLPYCVSMLMLISGCKSTAAQYKWRYYLVPPQNTLTKQIRDKLMLCKPLFIVHGRVKAFKTYTRVQKQNASAQKVGVAHALQDCINVKFQVLVQINEFLLYNKK